MSSGILLLNKPTGISSARVLTPLKRIFSGDRIGHTGTLDPFADGLLVVLVGSATRLSRWFLKLDKRYTAGVRLGAETDTLDTEGTVIAEAPRPDAAAVRNAADRYHGDIMQVPPAFSALNVNGRRAYARARAGETVDLPARPVSIRALSVEPSADGDRFAMDVTCSSGTYIRALARDIARDAGSRGYCETLRRESVGPFSLDAAVDIDSLMSAPHPEHSLLSPVEAMRRLDVMPLHPVPGPSVARVRNGQPLDRVFPADAFTGEASVRLLVDETGDAALAVIVRREDGRWRYETVFPADGAAA